MRLRTLAIRAAEAEEEEARVSEIRSTVTPAIRKSAVDVEETVEEGDIVVEEAPKTNADLGTLPNEYVKHTNIVTSE